MPTPKSNKPERRRKQPVDIAAIDSETPTPSQQSMKAGPGGGRETARRTNQLAAPKVAGAKAKPKSRAGTMMDKAVERKMHAAVSKGATPANLSAPEDAVPKQPRRQGAKKQSRAAKKAKR